MEYLTILISFLIVTFFLKWKYKIYDNTKERKITLLWLIIIPLIGLAWDYLATWRKHWVFPGEGLIGIRILNLPIEEYIFLFTAPFFAITVYKILEKKYK